MSEQQDKEKVVEWSFSFEKLGESINQQFRNMGIGDAEVKHDHFSAGLEGAASGDVKLKLSVGRVTVNGLTDSDNLIEADVAYTDEINFEVSGEREKKVRLEQKNYQGGDVAAPIKDVIGKLVNHEELRWDIGLSPSIPLSLDVTCGVGETRLDLSSLKLSKLKLVGGVGENHLILPAAESAYGVRIKSGVGGLRAMISEGAAVKLDIDGGVGSVQVQIPANAAVRVSVTTGLGGAKLPSNFRRVKGGDDFMAQRGVWETEGYSLASQQIQIEYKGGIGGFKVTTSAAEA